MRENGWIVMAIPSVVALGCPECQSPEVTVLPFSAGEASSRVWYLRCAACGHVWTLPKQVGAEPPAPLAHT
jgi:hypothetical protein